MVLNEQVEAPSSAFKRKFLQKSPDPMPPKKKVHLVSVSDDDMSDGETSAATALLRLHKSTMAQWVKLFDDDDSDDDEECNEDEKKIAQVLVKAAFSGNTSPALTKIIGKPALIKPDDHLQSILAAAGKAFKYTPYSDTKDFFEPVTKDFIAGYTMDVVKALRAEDVNTLRRLKSQGHTMLCGTKSGDSLLHSACRRNSETVLDFLLNECNVNCRLACDYGRTPLHDACWTSSPNWNVVSMLVNACPDLLYITDKRGFTPLAYVQKEHWREWCRFLDNQGAEKLVAREIL